MQQTWNEQRDAVLKNMRFEGYSFSSIAAHISTDGGVPITRNAAIGRATRLKLDGMGKEWQAPTTINLFRKTTTINTKVNKRPLPLRTPPTDAPHAPVKVTLMELREGMCKWPLGGLYDPVTHFCGCKTALGDSYCKYHKTKAFAPPRSFYVPQRLMEAA